MDPELAPSNPAAVAALRQEYRQAGLREADLDPDPITQLGRWLDDAVRHQLDEPNAMTLATADAAGRPSARTVLLKGLDGRGLVFYTNYRSQKARELAENPYAALVFCWTPLARQVRVSGIASRVSAEESDAYFASRPRGAQLGAWASDQSSVIASREVLEHRLVDVAEAFDDHERVPRPPHWGGFRVAPDMMEFWQGRPNRLHDRLRYTHTPDGWRIERLAP